MVADHLALSASDTGSQSRARAVFFVSDSTGITAETLGSALLANFPGLPFSRQFAAIRGMLRGRAPARERQR